VPLLIFFAKIRKECGIAREIKIKIIPKKLMHKKIMYICIVMSNSKLYKGSLNTIILKLLNENDKMYGYEITQKVKELTKGELKITEGALYPALHKLEAEGLLDVEVAKVDNRLRKYYKLTENGTKETANKLEELAEYIKTMQALVNPKLA
jgi:DNA-binding PadR family transcriptional regulator